MSISRYQKNLPLFASYLHLQGNIMLRRLVSPLKLDLEILCFSEWKVLAQCIICQKFFEASRRFFPHSSETFWPSQKLSHHDHELVCPGRFLNLLEFLLFFFLEDFEKFDEIIFWIILFLFYCLYIRKAWGDA